MEATVNRHLHIRLWFIDGFSISMPFIQDQLENRRKKTIFYWMICDFSGRIPLRSILTILIYWTSFDLLFSSAECIFGQPKFNGEIWNGLTCARWWVNNNPERHSPLGSRLRNILLCSFWIRCACRVTSCDALIHRMELFQFQFSGIINFFRSSRFRQTQ